MAAVAGMVSEEEALIPKTDMIRNTSTGTTGKRKRKKKKKRRRITCWSMMTNFKFLYFIISGICSCGLFLWWYALYPDTQIPYVVSGIVGLLVSVTGYRTFNELIALTTQSNVFEKNNQNMRNQHRSIRREVHKIKRANDDLKDTQMRLRSSNAKNKQNLGNFRDVQSFMQDMKIEDFQEVATKAKNIGSTWQKNLLQEERNMLHLIFDRYEMNNEQDNEKGMSKEQFDKFAACLPDAYRERFARLGTFEKLSNNTGIMEYADFEMVLDVFAEMVVTGTDIDVEIQKSSANLHEVPSIEEARNSTYGSWNTEESDEDSDDGGGGFFDRLTTWRKTRKKTKLRLSMGDGVVRHLVVKGSKTPKEANGSKTSSKFDILEAAQKEEKKAESAKSKLSPPKPKKTKSQIEAIHNIDECSLDDDEMNAYMANL